MKVNWKDLGLAMVVSLVLMCIFGVFFLSVLPSESDYEGSISHVGSNQGNTDLYRNIVLISLVGGFFSGTLFVYLVIEALKKKKK